MQRFLLLILATFALASSSFAQMDPCDPNAGSPPLPNPPYCSGILDYQCAQACQDPFYATMGASATEHCNAMIQADFTHALQVTTAENQRNADIAANDQRLQDDLAAAWADYQAGGSWEAYQAARNAAFGVWTTAQQDIQDTYAQAVLMADALRDATYDAHRALYNLELANANLAYLLCFADCCTEDN